MAWISVGHAEVNEAKAESGLTVRFSTAPAWATAAKAAMAMYFILKWMD